ncbi:hypothetical protein DSM104443_01952 [Usitatibacter rugosus]|uniref:Lipoprotein n=1 Tax=Usitatibacter rugosus TaxID=2732067 RepID=A0A6M4GV22_9PROT|nr:hypothetical protein [Usitatibacter rugosus]QJR10882.1 hypothetical protein DSM104443_01952 [Usitatibacter rugosus]
MKRVWVSLAVLALAGCAADTASTGSGAKEETTYRTGSNIPSKSTRDPSSTTVSKEDYERDRDRAPPPVNPQSGGRTR